MHKSTHHFDLANFWIGSQPEEVFVFGDLIFYGKENAEKRGVTRFYDRATGNPIAKNDPFALYLDENQHLKAMYLEAEQEDGYRRDQSVFGDGISIEDTLGVNEVKVRKCLKIEEETLYDELKILLTFPDPLKFLLCVHPTNSNANH